MTQACGRLCQAEGTARTKAWRLENITPHTQRDEQGEEGRGRTAVSRTWFLNSECHQKPNALNFIPC